jgi:hypothetical protein
MGDLVLHTFAFLGGAAIIGGVSYLAVSLQEWFIWHRGFLRRLDDRISKLEDR